MPRTPRPRGGDDSNLRLLSCHQSRHCHRRRQHTMGFGVVIRNLPALNHSLSTVLSLILSAIFSDYLVIELLPEYSINRLRGQVSGNTHANYICFVHCYMLVCHKFTQLRRHYHRFITIIALIVRYATANAVRKHSISHLLDHILTPSLRLPIHPPHPLQMTRSQLHAVSISAGCQQY